MKISNQVSNIDIVFPDGKFSLEKWTDYIETFLPNSSHIFLEDADVVHQWSKCLPIIQDVIKKGSKLEEAIESFITVTIDLDQKLRDQFGKSLEAEIILYLGLCNGAGWVKAINGQTRVLLGIEKIIELDWCDLNSMVGLIYHELGHVYQEQYGTLERMFDDSQDQLLWQLFTEGIAMYFEHKLVGDFNYYHQDKHGWKEYFDHNLDTLKKDFDRDLTTRKKQNYFGDWTNYHNFGDSGYYLGTKLIHFILRTNDFDSILSFDIGQVKAYYKEFLEVAYQ